METTLQHALSAPLVRFRLFSRSFDAAYEIQQSDNGLRFVRLIENSRTFYMGLYQPENGWLALTNASKFPQSDRRVRAFRWLAGLIWAGREEEIKNNGFHIQWEECGQ